MASRHGKEIIYGVNKETDTRLSQAEIWFRGDAIYHIGENGSVFEIKTHKDGAVSVQRPSR